MEKVYVLTTISHDKTYFGGVFESVNGAKQAAAALYGNEIAWREGWCGEDYFARLGDGIYSEALTVNAHVVGP